jgi:HlyD family secretion protein
MQIAVKRVVVTALIVVVSAGAFQIARGKARPKRQEVTYEFGEVKRQDVRNFVSATGIVQPWKVVDVKSDVAGRVNQLAVDLGDYVRPGQLIAMIDPTDTLAATEQATADLDSSVARRAQAESSLVQQKAQTAARIAAAGKAVHAARARVAQAEANKLAQPGLTESAILQAKASADSARQTKAQAGRTKEQLTAQLNELQQVTIPLNVETVEGNYEQAKINLSTAQVQYKRQRELLSLGYVSQNDVETAMVRMVTAQAALDAAKQRHRNMDKEIDLASSQIMARIEEAESRIEEAEGRIQQAEAALKQAEQNRVLIEVRGHEYDAAQASLEQAQADLVAAQAELAQVIVREREIDAADAQVRRNQSSVTQASANLGFTRITAPREGVVIAKNVEEGTVVPSSRGSVGSTDGLIAIGDVSRLWIVCSVDETDIGEVRVGQRVVVRVDAYPDEEKAGRVIRIDPQAVIEQNVVMIPVTVELENSDQRFKPGMNANCEFVVDELENVLTVPNEGIRGTPGNHFVQKLLNGEPSDFPVELGLSGPNATQLLGGLEEGEEVITRIIEPEKAETNNPFGNPLGQRRDRQRTGAGAAGGAGGRGGAPGAGGGAGGGGGGAGGGGGGRR